MLDQGVRPPARAMCLTIPTFGTDIWYGQHLNDIRWIPYRAIDDLAVPLDARRFDPESSPPRPDTAEDSPPSVQQAVEFSKLFRKEKARSSDNQLEFMRDRHIAILGSSLDREMVKMFCHHHDGAERYYKHHRYMYCHFKDYNFTLSQWMHFGVHQSDWFHGDDNATDPSIGTQIEHRIDNLFVPLAKQYGQPALLLFTSGLWGRPAH